ncbi:unnamed protein product [Soboliphyme baturini]|uniref:protein-disulfide reductase n=1 Tax=Soboliphyme baturini TaxID=241478 RepID=A0A183IF86_9BILA|nr:unnamed protein product [Soboliphyme baturini]
MQGLGTESMAPFLEGVSVMKHCSPHRMKLDAKHLEDKVVALFFSAGWYKPCRDFSNAFKKFCDKVSFKHFAVIVLNHDVREKDFKAYFLTGHKHWLWVQYGDPVIQTLKDEYNVYGIPTLMVVNNVGDVLVKNARSEIQQNPKGSEMVLNRWQKLAGVCPTSPTVIPTRNLFKKLQCFDVDDDQ